MLHLWEACVYSCAYYRAYYRHYPFSLSLLLLRDALTSSAARALPPRRSLALVAPPTTTTDAQGRHRSLWDKFCRHDLDAVVFVVDASDLDRAATARDELRRLFAKNAALRGRQLPLLVLANKTDKDGELLSLSDLTRALQLEELQTTHSVALETFEVSALKGTDVERAFQWLTDQV